MRLREESRVRRTNINTIGAVLGIACYLAVASVPSLADAQEEPVNLGRLAITRVSASSANGGGDYYGVRNLFDGGINLINGINYSTWMSLSGNPDGHWVKLEFDQPVQVNAVVVTAGSTNCPPTFQVQLIKHENGITRIVEESPNIGTKFDSRVYMVQKPQNRIDEVRIIFPGKDMIELQEVFVMGTPPAGVSRKVVKPRIAAPDEANKPDYQISINRTIRSDEDLARITAAENYYPPREDVVKAFDRGPVPSDAKLWWYGEFDDVRLPYTVTGDAVDYYQSLIKSYQTKTNTGFYYPKCNFIYDAGIDFHSRFAADGETYQDVYVVQMKIRFSAYAGPEAAIRFGKERTVILDKTGKVLKAIGDGKAPVLVS